MFCLFVCFDNGLYEIIKFYSFLKQTTLFPILTHQLLDQAKHHPNYANKYFEGDFYLKRVAMQMGLTLMLINFVYFRFSFYRFSFPVLHQIHRGRGGNGTLLSDCQLMIKF